MRRFIGVLMMTVLVAALALGGCAPADDSDEGSSAETKGPITVGSLLDSEGAVLGSMIIQMLEANGFETENKLQLGTPDVVRAALLEGEVDVTVDYTGSGQWYLEGQEGLEVWNDPVTAYETVKELDAEANNLIWLAPAPANNTELIAARIDFLEENDIVTMEDFADYVNSGGEVKIIGAQEWMDNTLGLAGFEEAYGFELADSQLIGLSTGVTAEMLKAAAEGTDGVNFALAYGTDGQLADLGLRIIEDPKSIPPVYEPSAVFRGEIISEYPEIPEILEPVFLSLDVAKLQQLNRSVAFDGADPAVVARDYLVENGFLK